VISETEAQAEVIPRLGARAAQRRTEREHIVLGLAPQRNAIELNLRTDRAVPNSARLRRQLVGLIVVGARSCSQPRKGLERHGRAQRKREAQLRSDVVLEDLHFVVGNHVLGRTGNPPEGADEMEGRLYLERCLYTKHCGVLEQVPLVSRGNGSAHERPDLGSHGWHLRGDRHRDCC
jgi:hypothetical protein